MNLEHSLHCFQFNHDLISYKNIDSITAIQFHAFVFNGKFDLTTE